MALFVSPRLSRRTIVRLLTIGTAGGLASPVLTSLVEACSGANSRSPRTTASYALPVDPDALNPLVAASVASGTVMSVIFAGMLRLRIDGTFEDNLAESHEVLNGGMVYRFKLRSGLRWEDGRPLTSRDFLFTYQTYVNPRTLAVSTAGWDQIQSVQTPDAATIVVRMKQPFGPFLLYVGCGLLLPQHVLAGVVDFSKTAFNRRPVGCGPFKLTSWDAGSRIVLEANDRYFRGRPRLNQFIFKIIPDAATQLDELRAGDLDIVGFNSANLWQQAGKLGHDIATIAYDGTTYVMNQYIQYRALKDVRVRQALDYATPKQAIVRDLLQRLATVAYADVPPTSPYFDGRVDHHDYDRAQARALLSAAGFSLKDGIQVDRAGNRLSVPIYTISSLPTYVNVAMVLQQEWQALGIETEVITQDQATAFGGGGPLWKGRDAALIYGRAQGTDPYDYTNWSSAQIPSDENAPGANLGRYSNPELDRLLVQGGLTSDLQTRKQVYDRIQEILARDVPATFLYWPKQLFAHRAWIGNFEPTAFSGPLWNVETWG